MAGIYVHIPFCRKACYYCNFHFSTSFQKKDELVEALIKEVKLQSHYLEGQTVETIYFGGGTPSALPAGDIEMILKEIKSFYPISPNAEVTLEANPDDVISENLQAWQRAGINRLSIGIQAFQDELLAGWNRNHLSKQALESIPLAQKEGYVNITADLIYGGQGLTDESWIQNLQMLVDFNIPHISSYALTVETGTVLAHQIKKGKIKSPEDEQSNRQYSIMQSILKQSGYEQYEISNFAKPGFQSKHNTNYWSGAHYLGIGPSSHSFNGISRQWNVANNIKYTHALEHDTVPFEKEVLTNIECYNEIVMTGLRTSAGISTNRIRLLKEDFEEYLHQSIRPFVEANKIFKTAAGNYALHPEFYFFADGIAAELFRENVRT
jgi:oxygen-independent coproporphyrinogen III oxidase